MQLSDSTLLRQQAYIDGQWRDAEDGQTITILNPADGQQLGTVPNMGTAETRTTILAAERAQATWSKTTAKARATLLHKWHQLILENREDLAIIMTWEQGKPLPESRAEVDYGASFIQWFAEECKRVYGETIPAHLSDRRVITIKQPVGVAAAVTPWNFPNAMITRKCAPALAAGCSTLVKPASQTPFSALALAELAHRAGIPAGVLNVITGKSREIGGEICANPIVRKLSFTGSTEVGKHLLSQCASTVKRVSMELGGHAPFIVFEDAQIDRAVQGAIASKYRAGGQTCVCANRIYVHESVYQEFSQKLAAAASQLTVGNGLHEGTDIGPLIDTQAVAKVEEHIADAMAKGATLLAGGKPHTLGGNFFLPTVLGDVTSDMQITSEETFGPVAPIISFRDEQEVIEYANSTPYGLASYFYTNDLGRLFRVSEQLDFGMVGINTGVISAEYAPFGGVKESGIGREGSHHGIDEYLEVKYLCVDGIEG